MAREWLGVTGSATHKRRRRWGGIQEWQRSQLPPEGAPSAPYHDHDHDRDRDQHGHKAAQWTEQARPQRQRKVWPTGTQ